MIDTPDRRLTRASVELVSREAAQKSTQVTVVLPRRGYAPLLGRILHDRTADKIAAVISQVPDAAATIIPFDVESRVHLLHARHAARLAAQEGARGQVASGQVARGQVASGQAAGQLVSAAVAEPGVGENAAPVPLNGRSERAPTGSAAHNGSTGAPARRPGVSAISELSAARKATIEGKVRSVEIHPVENSCVFDASVTDETGTLTAKFYGRTNIPGFEPGVRVRLDGKVSMRDDGPAMINPAYELLPRGES
jgi:hypothetical protein